MVFARAKPVSLWIGLVVLAFMLASCAGATGRLRPLNDTPTAGAAFVGQPQLVTFAELQANPETFQDRLIRVSGSFVTLLAPDCLPSNGPDARWALISESLRLDAVGFSELAGRLPENAALTVDGFFRLYEGPLGCGKEPPLGSAWFLAVTRVVQPNPLTLENITIIVPELQFGLLPVGGVVPVQTEDGSAPAVTSVASPAATATGVPVATSTLRATASLTPGGTATTATATPTPSRTPSGTPPTATPTGSSTPTTTATPMTATATTTAEAEPTATPLATGTSEAYPGPITTVPPDPYP
ncbi:MAG: hypothetical protein R3300_04390 [Candidatus Promineifilaceae bacterium]|nr:hypothetical protein [Candidatus Promineifilaceae bacterium]